MKKYIKNIKTAAVAVLVVGIVAFFIYVKHYYGTINLTYILTHFVVCFDIILNLLKDLYYKIMESLFTADNIKVIVIGAIIIYITRHIARHIDLKEFLKEFLRSTNKFESSWFSFERQVQAMREISNDEQETIETLNSMVSSEDNASEDIEKKILESKRKMKLIQTITSDPYLLKLLNMFIDKKVSKKKIPVNVFKTYDDPESFKSIFEITYENGYVILNGIKDDIKELVNEIYLDISTRY